MRRGLSFARQVHPSSLACRSLIFSGLATAQRLALGTVPGFLFHRLPIRSVRSTSIRPASETTLDAGRRPALLPSLFTCPQDDVWVSEACERYSHGSFRRPESIPSTARINTFDCGADRRYHTVRENASTPPVPSPRISESTPSESPSASRMEPSRDSNLLATPSTTPCPRRPDLMPSMHPPPQCAPNQRVASTRSSINSNASGAPPECPQHHSPSALG
ncbi:hypothetical protein RB213_000392 [Colletotrichum asianum]